MAVYVVTGRLGSGKSLACVGRIRDAVLSGRRVATNLDLFLEKILPAAGRKIDVMRLPDKPAVSDLVSLGLGTSEVDESRNGLLVLDELGSWLNAREWGDKSRSAFIDWLIHSRKYGWDVYLICQHLSQIDKQVREALVEYHVVCRRLDRLRIPFVGWLISLITCGLWKGYMPKLHFGIVRYGAAHDSLIAERWVYLGTDLYQGYNTRQVFSSTYDAGLFSYLTPWHLVGRYRKTLLQRFRLWAGFDVDRKVRSPSIRLLPLLRLPAALRWAAARRLVERGLL